MCMSPEEMSSARIERNIEGLARFIEEDERAGLNVRANMYRGRVKSFEAILKERVDNGTYDTAGTR